MNSEGGTEKAEAAKCALCIPVTGLRAQELSRSRAQEKKWQKWKRTRSISNDRDVATRLRNHSVCVIGKTDYLKSEGTLEHAQNMAAHSSPRTTKLYDRRNDETALDEYEKVRI